MNIINKVSDFLGVYPIFTEIVLAFMAIVSGLVLLGLLSVYIFSFVVEFFKGSKEEEQQKTNVKGAKHGKRNR